MKKTAPKQNTEPGTRSDRSFVPLSWVVQKISSCRGGPKCCIWGQPTALQCPMCLMQWERCVGEGDYNSNNRVEKNTIFFASLLYKNHLTLYFCFGVIDDTAVFHVQDVIVAITFQLIKINIYCYTEFNKAKYFSCLFLFFSHIFFAFTGGSCIRSRVFSPVRA